MRRRTKQDKFLMLQAIVAIITVVTTMGAILSQLIKNESPTETILGFLGINVLMFFVLYIYIFTQKREIVLVKNTLFLLFFIYHINLVAFILMVNIPNISHFLLPISIGGMLVALLLDTHLGIVINAFFSLIASMMSTNPYEALVFFLITGTIASLLIILTKQRRNIVFVAVTIMGVNALLVLFMNLFVLDNFKIMDLIYGVLNGCFSVIITVGSLPLWEALFDVVTPLKLLELSNSDQKLIQRLLNEAPGTFHHSQLVANLAETAVKDIGGDYLLARVGALYHDIGKLKNPDLFKENQNGDNPHDDFEPEKSAKIILNHVIHGVQLAQEYKLPKNVRDIIQQHQGTTLIKYFFHKAKEQQPGKEILERDYRYSGPRPQSNEAAIVMLADSSEAAVRCIPQKDKDLQAIEQTIKKIIKMKFDEGQLEESDLKIKDLPYIANAFLKVYKGMYHNRIEYPKGEGE